MEEGKWAQSVTPRREAIHKRQLLGKGKSVFFNRYWVYQPHSRGLYAQLSANTNWIPWFLLLLLVLRERTCSRMGRDVKEYVGGDGAGERQYQNIE